MNILKRIISHILMVTTAVAAVSVPASASRYKDVADDAYYRDAVEAISTYGIASGYAGYYEPNSHVTRAEFAKMVTLASGLEDEVHSNAAKRRFDDVPLNHWGNGYINTSAENNLIVGYPDGQFMPEKKITFAEAVTVLLRAMDYSSADLGDNWPYAYMVKAKGLGLTEGIKLGDNSYIPRGDLAIVINRALQSKLNGSQEKLISKMDIKMTDELLVIATKNEDSSLQNDEIKTSAGTYNLANTELEFTPLTKVELVLDDNGKVINFNTTYTPKKAVTTVDGVVDGTVYFANGSNTKSLGVTDSTSVYCDGSISNYGSFKSSIENGTTVSIIYDETGRVGYLVFNDANYTQAVAVRTDIYAALESVGVSKEDVDAATVIRNGETASLSDVQKYDVVYYLADNSTIYLYSDKLSGVYTKAIPSKTNVSQVEISGNILDVETGTAAYKLGEKSGSYKLNSKITALLGKDGKIVDVVDLNSGLTASYGILLSYSTEMSEDMLEIGKQYKYITVLNSEGNTVKYKTSGNYSERIGYVGKISFDNDGNATFASVSNNGTRVLGKIDKNNRKIGDRWLTQDCVILERTYMPETATGTATAQVIELDDFADDELSEKNVVYAVTSGAFGDISLLIVENVTKDQYTYGVLTGINTTITDTRVSGTYTVLANGKSQTYSTEFASNIKNGAAVGIVVDGGKLVSIKALVSVKTGVNLSAIDFSRVKVGDNVYRLADDVQIVKKGSAGSYTGISIYEADEYIGKTVNLYADEMVSNGGLIRVITIN